MSKFKISIRIKSAFKSIIPYNSILYKGIKKLLNYNAHNIGIWNFDVLDAFGKQRTDIFFIQVGSNDGQSGDPLSELIKQNGWKGILVEPVPYIFDKLKQNYNDYANSLFFENCAIAEKVGVFKFFRLRKSDLDNLPAWYDQLGSFKRDIVLKHRELIEKFDELFIEDLVTATTFKELISKYNIKSLDVIHIDTEGYDYEIIKTIPFELFDINLVMFEHRHLSSKDFKNGVKILTKRGFIVKRCNDNDTIAIKRTIVRALEYSS